MSWRLAKAIEDLRSEVNARWPNRDKTSDGTIGDAAHAGRHSDHNPWLNNTVRAVDFDVDGIDAAWLAEHIRKLGAAGDKRLRKGGYVIFNRRITKTDWSGWSVYNGSNPHTKHVHISVSTDGYDLRGSWGIVGGGSTGKDDDVNLSDKFSLKGYEAGGIRNQDELSVKGALADASIAKQAYDLLKGKVLPMLDELAAKVANLDEDTFKVAKDIKWLKTEVRKAKGESGEGDEA